ncbi:MAG: hypothetical protein HZB19_00135 [Chloroflexi bacterium]|nr:hypothetical protein [Chloroflexota bacterium]
MRKILVPLILLGVILSSCGTLEVGFDVTPSPDAAGNGSAPTVAAPILSMESTSGEIQQAMIFSATRWQTIWMDGVAAHYSPDGTIAQTIREQVWIEQSTPRFRVLMSGADVNAVETLKISDGMSVIDLNLATGQSTSVSMPDGAHVG